jgi:diadenosine tetraphosphate (Ap4A) HIT family hydrolase
MYDDDLNCEFCYEKIKKRIVAENNSVVAIKDTYPVTEAHHLILPKRHVIDYFEMTPDERQDAEGLIRVLKKRIEEKDKTITGFNIGTNCGESAGQTIFHAHIHFIPRRDGDTPNPRGGVRGVIPDKMNY